MSKKIITVENGEEVKFKRNVITIFSGDKALEFRYPNKLIYKSVLDKLKADDTAAAFEILFDDCLNQLDNKFEFEDKVYYFEELANKFLGFKEMNLVAEDNKYNISVNGKEFIISKPDRNQVKELFNLNLKSSIDALNYVYRNLKISGYEFDLNNNIEDIVDYYSMHQLASVLVFNKNLDLKKK